VNLDDIRKSYLRKADTARNNWLELPISDVTEAIADFFMI